MSRPVWRFPDGEVGTWACLGAVSERGVRVWLRDPTHTPREATLTLDGRVAARARLAPASAHGGIAAADLVLDAPAPNAAVRVEVAGLVRHATLAPPPGAPAAFSFGFGSCHLPFAGPPSAVTVHGGAAIYPLMARVLRTRGARFLLLLGDQIYSDGLAGVRPRAALQRLAASGQPLPSHEALVAFYRRVYCGFFAQAGFRALLEGWPSYLIWDDHDIVDGWGSFLRVGEVERRLFAAADVTFRAWQHLHNPAATLDDAPPYDFSFWYGDVGFCVLDLRGARDFPSGTLLGAAQWQRVERFLAEATARDTPTLFIVATVPVFHFMPMLVWALENLEGAPGTDGRDRWSTTRFRAERDVLCERLFAWQTERPERQVFLLSGDVHAGAAFRVTRPGRPGRLHQWTSSAFTTPSTLSHHLANWLGTTFVNVGLSGYRAARERLELRNNFGLIALQPLPTGGHQVSLTLHGYHAGQRALRAHAPIVARPRRG